MLTSRFSNALQYAVELHAAQTRKVSGEPYLAHLLGAASIVLDYGGSEDEAIAALLHDAIEDQGGQVAREEILRRFGERIAAIVEDCTDADTLPKPPWRERKEAFLEKLRAASPSVRLVVAADKLHNLRSLSREYRRHGESLWQHFKGSRDGTLWYHRTVVEILEDVVNHREGEAPAEPPGERTSEAFPAARQEPRPPDTKFQLLVDELKRTAGELERLVLGQTS